MAKKRFVDGYTAGTMSGNLRKIIIDTETGVNYFMATSNQAMAAGGICVLVDKDGKPIITPIDTIEE